MTTSTRHACLAAVWDADACLTLLHALQTCSPADKLHFGRFRSRTTQPDFKDMFYLKGKWKLMCKWRQDSNTRGKSLPNNVRMWWMEVDLLNGINKNGRIRKNYSTRNSNHSLQDNYLPVGCKGTSGVRSSHSPDLMFFIMFKCSFSFDCESVLKTFLEMTNELFPCRDR